MKVFRSFNKSQSLQNKLLIGIFTLLFILLCGLGYYQHNNMKRYLYTSKIEFLDSRFKNINKEIIIETNNQELLKENIDLILKKISVDEVGIAIINNQGEVVASKNSYNGILTEISEDKTSVINIPIFTPNHYLKILDSNTLAKGYSVVKDEEGKEQIVIWRQLGNIDKPTGLVQISTYLDSSNKILRAQTKAYIFAAMSVLVIGGVLIIGLVRHTLIPLKETANKIDEINEDTLNIRLNENSGLIEIDKLDMKFNNMLEKLEEAIVRDREINEKMRSFILDASHELRTPLTSIKGFIEVLQCGGAKNAEQLNLALTSMLQETDRLSKLVENLLTLTKIDGGYQVNFKVEDIGNIVKGIEPQLKIITKDRILKINLQGGNYSKVNEDQIKQVIYNLVQNAVNHTSESRGEIKIEVVECSRSNSNYVELRVEDNGHGINSEKLKYIFDRFYRVDTHRSRRQGGYGLGLSIVKSIVDNHKGEIVVESEEGKGTRFTIFLERVTSA